MLYLIVLTNNVKIHTYTVYDIPFVSFSYCVVLSTKLLVHFEIAFEDLYF